MNATVKLIAAIVLFVSITAPNPSTAQANSKIQRENNLIESIDSILHDQVINHQIPGAVILIKEGNHIIWKEAYGYTKKFDQFGKILPEAELMNKTNLFDIASLTKVVGTTTAIMYLADKQLISVNDSVSKYINAFNTAEKKAITIQQLLTHTAGLPEWYPMYYKSNNKAATYNLIAQLPLSYPIGKQRKYSDLGFTILGQIIEVVSGMPLDQFLREKIHEPLGMMHTMYNPLKNGNTLKIAPT
ncbi:MAG: beta-lactamase [Chitinophagaceae bacterium]|nr:MAG: beta-lactamase [Chitinophagaceae bacterium]